MAAFTYKEWVCFIGAAPTATTAYVTGCVVCVCVYGLVARCCWVELHAMYVVAGDECVCTKIPIYIALNGSA